MAEAKGSVHDFEVFRQSGIHMLDDILLVCDRGFQGICDIHALSLIPFKKPRNGTLTAEKKAFNRNLSKFRILIEHMNRRIKHFKMLQMRYRNNSASICSAFRLFVVCITMNCGFRTGLIYYELNHL